MLKDQWNSFRCFTVCWNNGRAFRVSYEQAENSCKNGNLGLNMFLYWDVLILLTLRFLDGTVHSIHHCCVLNIFLSWINLIFQHSTSVIGADNVQICVDVAAQLGRWKGHQTDGRKQTSAGKTFIQASKSIVSRTFHSIAFGWAESLRYQKGI